MADKPQAVAAAFGVIGLKCRNAQSILTNLETNFQVKASTEGGFLSLDQNGQQANVGQVLQAYVKKFPEHFVGHSGEVRYKSDVPADAKVTFIRDHGFSAWEALPASATSPGAQHVVKPTIVSTQLTQAQWLTLTPSERSQAISGWGKDGASNVAAIMARR